MKIYIKNMVSQRCKLFVQSELEKLDVGYTNISLGEVDLSEKISEINIAALSLGLKERGLEILPGKKNFLVERLRAFIVKMIYYSNELPTENYSHYISSHFHHNYTYLANIFSASEGLTIEHFIISNKIEKVKSFLQNDQFTLTEIAYKMHYSSVAHLSNQFKKVTGITPTYYKKKVMRRKNQRL